MRYVFDCQDDENRHDLIFEDWEVGESWRSWRRRYPPGSFEVDYGQWCSGARTEMTYKIRSLLLVAGVLTAVLMTSPARAQTSTSSPMALPSPPAIYSLDGVTLGSNIGDVIHKRGKPTSRSRSIYTWANVQGGALTLTTDAAGAIVIVDVRAGRREVRSVDVSGTEERFNDGGHVNWLQPAWANRSSTDACGPSLHGSPCWGFLLPRGAELVMNFGGDNGGADWDLTELILGRRSILAAAKIISKASP